MLPLGATVLSMMDDALYVYKAGSGAPEFVEAVAWDKSGFSGYVSRLLDKKCGGKPVLILNDSVEQYYRKERIFTAGVGTLDKKAMVDRKLAMVFPTYSVRTAIALKEKKTAQKDKDGDDGGAPASDVFLFSAIANSEQLTLTTSSIVRSSAGVKGLGLLPLESIGMVEKMAKSVVPKGQKQGQWTLFIGQQRNGNLRQVVVKDGMLALTRTTHVNEGESVDDSLWARDVVQEFEATMNYLARLGFQQDEGLDVILVSSQSKGDAVAEHIGDQHNYYSLEPSKAASCIGIGGAKKMHAHYADQLYVAWAAKKLALSYSMPVNALQPVGQMRSGVGFASFAACGAALYFLYLTSMNFTSYLDATSTIRDEERKKISVETQYNKEVQKMSDLGVDLPLVQASEGVYKKLELGHVQLVGLIQKIASSTQGDYSVQSLAMEGNDAVIDFGDVATKDKTKKDKIISSSQDKYSYQIRLRLRFLGSKDLELANIELRDLRGELRRVLPEHEVDITKFLGDGQYITDSQLSQGASLQQESLAEIVIKKVTGDG